MLGSQALETAIGLALLFFVLATATSALVELVSKVLKKRHRDLEQAIGAMLKEGDVDWAKSETLDAAFRDTTIYRSARIAAGKAGVTYLSAKSFADAAVELYRKAENVPPGLAARMEDVYADVGEDLLRFKAGLESWFDETMKSLENQYKKWATTWLFFAGLALAVAVNASAVNVVQELWNDQATRAAVVAAAEASVNAPGEDSTKDGGESLIESIAEQTDELQQLGLPVGWSKATPAPTADPLWWLTHVLGWLLTGALLMLGAPFWFDLLGRLVSLRNAGKAPNPATKDEASATASVVRAEARASGPAGGGSASGASPPATSSTLDVFLGRSPGAPFAATGSTATTTNATAFTRRLAGR